MFLFRISVFTHAPCDSVGQHTDFFFSSFSSSSSFFFIPPTFLFLLGTENSAGGGMGHWLCMPSCFRNHKLKEALKKSKCWLLTKLALGILKKINPFFILMYSIHFKTDFSMKKKSPLPSFPYYSRSQNCTIPTII